MVPVRLHQDLHTQLWHLDGTPWTRFELERAVLLVIARLNQSAGANIPYMYLDPNPTTCAWFHSDCGDADPPQPSLCEIPGTINIVPSHCIGPLHTWSATGAGHIIYLKRTLNAGSAVPYEHFAVEPSTATVIHTILMHEIGHGLGINHPNECGDPQWATICPTGSEPCAVMHTYLWHMRSADYLMPDDRAGLRVQYGSRPEPVEQHFESSNLSLGMVEWFFPNVDIEGFSAGSSDPSVSPTSTTIAGYSRSLLGQPRVYAWDWATFAVTDLGTPTGHISNGPLASAQSSSHRFVASSSYRMSSDARRWRRRIRSANRPAGTGGWSTAQSNPPENTTGDTVTGGISATWNPQQSHLVNAFRSTTGSVLLQVGTTGSPFNTGVLSSSTPSITCAPGSGLNCIAVVVEPGSPFTPSEYRLRWFRFSSSSGGGFSTGPIFTEPWIIWSGDPQVSTYRVGSGYEYVVTYRQAIGESINYAWVLHMPTGGSEFTFWGSVATTTGRPFHVANGSTRDLELFVFRN